MFANKATKARELVHWVLEPSLAGVVGFIETNKKLGFS